MITKSSVMEILSLIVKHESRFINLEEKIDLQISGFAFPKRAPSSWKKIYFEKQLFQWKLFKNKWISKYSKFWWIYGSKNSFSQQNY